MFKFLDLEPEAFGIDICDSSIKIAKLKKRGRYFKLSSWGEGGIEPGIVEGGEIKSEEGLARAIKKAVLKVKGERLDTENAVVSLPENKAFLQVVKMPKMNPEELKTAVAFEAENYVPLPVDKCFIDFQIISSSADHLDILMAATPKEISNSYFSSLRRAELCPLVLEVESQSIVRAIVKNEFSEKPLLILDFGKNSASFIIFHRNSILFTSSVPVSSESLTKAISESLKVNIDEAEKIKIGKGIKAAKAMLPIIKELSDNAKKCLKYYDSHKENKENISQILICGGGANLKGLPESLSSALKIKAAVANPWVNVFPNSMEDIPELNFEKSVGFSTAIGLALRGIKIEHD